MTHNNIPCVVSMQLNQHLAEQEAAQLHQDRIDAKAEELEAEYRSDLDFTAMALIEDNPEEAANVIAMVLSHGLRNAQLNSHQHLDFNRWARLQWLSIDEDFIPRIAQEFAEAQINREQQDAIFDY